MKRASLLIAANILFAISFAQAQTAPQCSEETEERNRQLARRFYEKVWFSNNPAVVDEIFAPQYVVHDTGDRKGVTEIAEMQKDIAAFVWNNGQFSGTIDYQIAECDIVATRWQGKFQPNSLWLRLVNGREHVPIINVFRFKNGKIVEVWNHRHDIDMTAGHIVFLKGAMIGLLPGLILLITSLLLWRAMRKQRRLIKR